MDRPAGRVTLHDVAEKLGLSVTQTSRALNDRWDVAASTKERARAVAEELGYLPNLEARRLKTGSTRADAIGLVLPQAELRFNDAFFAELLSSLVEAASATGREVRLTASLGPITDLRTYQDAIRAQQVDGFVLVRTEVDDPRIRFLESAGFPFVSFGRSSDGSGFAFVDDADDVMQPVAEHLAELGHRRVACVVEPGRFSMSHFRFRSFRDAATESGIEIDPDLVVEAEFHEDSGYVAARALLARDDPPTAIVALNDLLALGALAAARDSGIGVPDDVSITGFDDVPASRYATPGLTTVRRSPSQVGETLCRQLLDQIDGTAEAAPQVFLAPELVVRESTAPPPG